MSLRWTEEQYEAFRKRQQGKVVTPHRVLPVSKMTGVVRGRKAPNKTERAYAELFLEPLKLTGEVQEYKFHSICLVLGVDFRYYPDYLVQPRNGRPQVHEVKGGFIREDAIKTFKAAVEQFKDFFVFFLCQKTNSGEWRITRYKGG